jgi:hypothetical protein
LPLLALLAAAGVLAVGIRKNLPGLRVGGAAGFAVAIALSMATYFAAGERGDLDVGPIPSGTPVNLLANLDVSRGDKAELVRTVLKAKKLFLAMKAENVVGSAAVDRLAQEVGSQLLRFSKSPDLIEDRGHWFGTRLPDEDKRALIAFMKTF